MADALRFARAEALRTGRPHGVEASAAAQQVRLYRLDFSVDPPDREYVVRHPLDKKLYDLQFQAAGPLAGARLESVAIRYAGLEPGQAFLHFDARGTPRLYDAGALRRLESAIIRVSGAGDEVLLQVNPVTGRVTAL
ncbi:hypothetical protein [Desulfuromonas sp.]|uniref:hypothetical protein n=1 Tax=Desulfuromonas sp. TaxID=892 RepID=UPI0034304FF4